MRRWIRFSAIALILAAVTMQVPSMAPHAASAPASPVSALGGAATTAPAVVGRSWRQRRLMRMPSQHAGGASLGGKFYVVGGEVLGTLLPLVQVYNPSTNRWVIRAHLPAARARVAVVATSTRLWAVGGTSPTRAPTHTLYRYNPAANRWVRGAMMPAALAGVAAVTASVGGHETILAFGGADAAGAAQSTTYLYDTVTDTWSTGTGMPSALSDAQAIRVAGTVYLFGGLDAAGNPSLSMFRYDVVSGNWMTPGASMRVNAFGPIGAAAGLDGRIYAVGLDWPARRVDAYDPASDSWTTSPPNLLHPQAYPAMTTIGARIYAAGGNPGSTTITSSTLEVLHVA